MAADCDNCGKVIPTSDFEICSIKRKERKVNERVCLGADCPHCEYRNTIRYCEGEDNLRRNAINPARIAVGG